MEHYEAELAKAVEGRQDLANAEKLLDLPITVYPEIVSIQKDMNGYRLIYDIYQEQKVTFNGSLGKKINKIKLKNQAHLILFSLLILMFFHRLQSTNGLRPYGQT